MSKQLDKISKENIFRDNTIKKTPVNTELTEWETSVANQLKSSTYAIGDTQFVLANAPDPGYASSIINVCNKQGMDCILISGQDVILQGQSPAMADVKKQLANLISTQTRKTYRDNTVSYEGVHTKSATDAVNAANSISRKYQEAAYLDIAKQAGIQNHGQVNVTCIDATKARYADDIAHLLYNQGVKNPVVVTNNPSGLTNVTISVDKQVSATLGAQYAVNAINSSNPNVQHFVFENQADATAFISSVNQECAHVQQVKDALYESGIQSHGSINLAILQNISRDDAEMAASMMSQNTRNAMVAYKAGDHYEIAFSNRTQLGQRMTELYGDSHGQNSSSPNSNSTTLRFESQKEMNEFLNDAHVQALAIQRGLDNKTLNMLHQGMSNGQLIGDTYVVDLNINAQQALHMQSTMEQFVPNVMVKSQQDDRFTVCVDSHSDMGKYLAKQYSQNLSAAGVNTNTFSFKSQSEADAFIKAGNDFLQEQSRDGNEMATIDTDDMDISD